MLIIGLTGGIGSGKTVVSKLFSKHGIPIIDADVIAREVTNPDQSAYIEIVKHFGEPILLEGGALNRTKIREIIFNNKNERLWLEKILHPLINQKIIHDVANLKSPYCIIVIPLLIESKSYSFIDRVLVVDADPALQIERVKIRDNVSALEVQIIVDAQISREERLKSANDVINNDGTFEELEKHVNNMHHFYTEIAKKPINQK